MHAQSYWTARPATATTTAKESHVPIIRTQSGRIRKLIKIKNPILTGELLCPPPLVAEGEEVENAIPGGTLNALCEPLACTPQFPSHAVTASQHPCPT